MGNPIGPRNPSANWTRTVKKAFRALGEGVKEWATKPAPEVLPPDFAERLGEDINLLDIFPGGAGVGAITRKAAIGQAARGWRSLLGITREAEKTALKSERKKMVGALARMPKESLEPLRGVTILPRMETAKAALGYKGKLFGKLFYYPGGMEGKIPLDPLETISHELLGHLQALTPAKAGKFKKHFREITKELAKGDPGAHEKFAYRMGELTERYHKMKPGAMTMEDVKLLTEMATSEAAWTPGLAPFLRPMGR